MPKINRGNPNAKRRPTAPTVERITLHGTEYATPFADRFRLMTHEEFHDLIDSIVDHGLDEAIILYTSPVYGESILDGINRANAVNRLKLPSNRVPLDHRGKLTDDEAAAICELRNEHRRQLTPEDMAARRAERLKRVAKARSKGKSLRAIAEEEKVSEKQVRDDLKRAGSDVSPDRIKGLDGKNRPAKKPIKKTPAPDPPTPPTESGSVSGSTAQGYAVETPTIPGAKQPDPQKTAPATAPAPVPIVTHSEPFSHVPAPTFDRLLQFATTLRNRLNRFLDSKAHTDGAELRFALVDMLKLIDNEGLAEPPLVVTPPPSVLDPSKKESRNAMLARNKAAAAQVIKDLHIPMKHKPGCPVADVDAALDELETAFPVARNGKPR